jgi:ribosome-binding protein aMBF1 (putative translation factor)
MNEKHCEICGSELSDSEIKICDSCKAIMINQNLDLNGFKI